MSRRARVVLATLAAVDVLAFVLTLHAHADYRPRHGGPTVMPLGQLMGWIVTVSLFLLIVFVLGIALRERLVKRAVARRVADPGRTQLR